MSYMCMHMLAGFSSRPTKLGVQEFRDRDSLASVIVTECRTELTYDRKEASLCVCVWWGGQMSFLKEIVLN